MRVKMEKNVSLARESNEPNNLNTPNSDNIIVASKYPRRNVEHGS